MRDFFYEYDEEKGWENRFTKVLGNGLPEA